MTNSEFITRIASFAVADMQRTRIAASLTIAQAALESGWGTSGLTLKAGNLFGIKGSGPAGSLALPTTEYRNGQAVQVTAQFRSYHNWGESIADHSALITGGVSWNPKLYSKAIGVDGKTAAREIAAAGYATDPGYASKLIQIMDSYNLYQYDELKEDEEMSAEDKQKIAALETELRELKELLAGLSVSRDTLKAGVQEQGQAIKGVTERLAVIEGRTVMNVPAWAEPAVQAASAAGLLDTPSGGSFDFYRMLTVLNRAGLLVTSKGV
ncbi:Mannosyl-glycoprotein endo-beta-N-acetylglucosamidase [Paenibacillus sp. FSL R7-277]|uniref:glycoside hydrolase family 73 protein n=1 Tax=Paenibacillus sp. FSL R7-277 TaxID=1227352 RepID=UPI0003E25A18|nr:glucosaminidase domain-containing protein [Paenibacillus sp. FSL R7-277]ETT63187.1 Mannosyl-glycoprotein endo-beta-N-acetylglucosamidase [Paenibacillus sp. FSL R7-277]